MQRRWAGMAPKRHRDGRRRPAARQRVYLLCGPSLSGKTSLGTRMVSVLGLRSLSFDEINAERGLPFGAGGLEHEWAATLEIALQRLRAYLSAGDSVVVDDTFCYRWLRDRFCSVARQLGATPQIVYLEVEPAILRRRYDSFRASGERAVLSPSAFDEHIRAFEAPSADEPLIRFSSFEAASEWVHNQPPSSSS